MEWTTHGRMSMSEPPNPKGRREKEGTYTTFTHTHWFGAPFIVNGALELEKPWVRQITEPPIGRMIHIHLQIT